MLLRFSVRPAIECSPPKWDFMTERVGHSAVSKLTITGPSDADVFHPKPFRDDFFGSPNTACGIGSGQMTSEIGLPNRTAAKRNHSLESLPLLRKSAADGIPFPKLNAHWCEEVRDRFLS